MFSKKCSMFHGTFLFVTNLNGSRVCSMCCFVVYLGLNYFTEGKLALEYSVHKICGETLQYNEDCYVINIKLPTFNKHWHKLALTISHNQN